MGEKDLPCPPPPPPPPGFPGEMQQGSSFSFTPVTQGLLGIYGYLCENHILVKLRVKDTLQRKKWHNFNKVAAGAAYTIVCR